MTWPSVRALAIQTSLPQRLGVGLGAALWFTSWSLDVAAHHSTATTRVNGAIDIRQTPSAKDAAPERLDAALRYDFLLFDRVLAGTAPYTDAAMGSAALSMVTLSAGVEFPSRTRATLRVPFGVSTLQESDGSSQSTSGAGDMQVLLGQELVSLFATEELPFTILLQGGVLAPTGKYDPEAALSVTDVGGYKAGELQLATYNTRTSLGLGAWAALAALQLDWDVVKEFSAQFSTALLAPVTNTVDDIRWGADVEVGIATRTWLYQEVVSLLVGVDYRFHGQDEVPAVELFGAERVEVGGRNELALRAGVGANFSEDVSCALGGRLPFWQQASGVQLVETAAITLGCGYALGL